MRDILLVAGIVAVASCGSSAPPASPSPTPPPGTSYQTSGRVVDALTSTADGGIRIVLPTNESTMSDASGAFTLTSSTYNQVAQLVTFNGASVVTRKTYLHVPGSSLTASLIPASFNLAAFDEMFRVPMLQRWESIPPLSVEMRELKFSDRNASAATTLPGQMTDDEATSIIDDLTWALPQLTGGTFKAFASVTRQSSPENVSVRFLNDGRISVVRYVGLEDATGAIGLGTWLFHTDGSITGGAIMLDRDYERRNTVLRRAVRAHELGHALGYNHVTLALSVMSPVATTEPTAFDLAACQIAFQRPPGNRTPDTDLDFLSLNRVSRGMWSQPIR